uniref:CSON000817 protein n=1 Tax=Culicoides sonorensis TaxID=179676 RepID=A0A336KY70_CULSO
MGQRDGFSLYDIEKINALYQCNNQVGGNGNNIQPRPGFPISGGQIKPTRGPVKPNFPSYPSGSFYPGPPGPYPPPYGPSGPYPGPSGPYPGPSGFGPSGPFPPGPGFSGPSGPYPPPPFGPSGPFPFDTKQNENST